MQKNRSYWSYLIQSKGRHGVHSPFVYDFVDKCLTTKVDKNFRTTRKKWFQKLSREKELFEISDHGAGSKKMNHLRSVAELAKKASSAGVYGNVLYQICKHYQPKTILEFGTSIGTGVIHMKAGNPSAQIVTIEGCDRILEKAYQQFDYWKLDHVFPICTQFDHFIKLPPIHQYDLVFLDGNHEGSATMRYLNQLENQTHNETVFIMDDIRWSEDMWNTWQQIVADERFHVTIDLGRMGLIWRRKQQVKEHFTIRPVILKTRFF
jgi:predicted O-methyltransferase YrrM